MMTMGATNITMMMDDVRSILGGFKGGGVSRPPHPLPLS